MLVSPVHTPIVGGNTTLVGDGIKTWRWQAVNLRHSRARGADRVRGSAGDQGSRQSPTAALALSAHHLDVEVGIILRQNL